ncbi:MULTISPECIES: transaldolase family protein [unclassified Mesorhizobium]|uniref:transaldolase family protein n=1 Tax=unclassified Mesorhizobium TaxID=325217 RepID=UPI001FEEC662|nr:MULTISPECIES: transaldolase family protein [unclassified Mesorhizobium]
MNVTTRLHELGQSLWLDNITRDLLSSGTLERYCTEFSVTGLTSNPTIFDEAIKNSTAYDKALHRNAREGKAGAIPAAPPFANLLQAEPYRPDG